MSKSLNKAMVIGNITRDIELKYTQGGTAVTKFSVATNRTWTQNNEKKEAVDYHNITAWGKLAEICGQILSKGSKVYVSGRMQTTKYQDKNGNDRYSFEIVAEELIVLSSRPKSEEMQAVENSGLTEPPENYTSGEDISDDIPF